MKRKSIKYLGWTGYPLHFQTYLTEKRETPDLIDLTIHGAPNYVGFIETLGGTMDIIPAGEVYNALDMGIVQGLCWPEMGIADYGWHEHVKYIWGLSFSSVDAAFIMNLDSWNEPHKEQQALLNTLILEMENEMATYWSKTKDTDRKALLKKSLEEVRFSEADEENLLETFYEVCWEYFLEKAPDAAELRPLMSK